MRLFQRLRDLAAFGGLWLVAACGSTPSSPPPDLAECSEGRSRCGGGCVDLNGNNENCGACGTVCAVADGLTCVIGKCTLVCPKEQTACDGKSCVNLAADPQSCGKCGSACLPGQVCSQGVCSLKCGGMLVNCEGACIDTTRDAANCGGCKLPCPDGNLCVDGKCQLSCPNMQMACSGRCVDVLRDSANCGVCGNGCKPGEQCLDGLCKISCQQGLTECAKSCVNTQSDNDNCGACGSKCPQGQVCSAGKCDVQCRLGFDNCSGDCVKLLADAQNCGKCANACRNTEQCLAGVCTSNCANGQIECGGGCVDPKTDLANCGKCGVACAMGQVCANGACGLLCKAPLSTCGNRCVDTRFDPSHCGGCDRACKPAPNSTPGCSNGVCNIGGCDKNFNNCDGDAANGCESNGLTDNRNCAGCGKACKPTDACCGGGCQNVMVDNNNCGACGNGCKQGLKCCGGACLDPRFSMVASLDCKRPFIVHSTSGAEFGMNGKVDQLVPGMGGLTTVDAKDNPPPAQSPFLWIAMHASNQVNKVDARTGAVLGTYPSRGNHPSRVAVALDNSAWVGNRGDNAPNDGTQSNLVQILPDGTPGCTIKNAKDGAPMPFLRGVAIDGNGYVWASTWNDRRVHKIDPAKCEVIGDYLLNGPQGQAGYAYGLAVDRNGILWPSDASTGWVIALDVKAADPGLNAVKYAVNLGGGCRYGIVLDRDSNVFMSNCNGNGLWRIDAKTQAATLVNANAPSGGYGITIDLAGNIYQASGGNRVNKYQGGTGAYLVSFTFPNFNNPSGSGSFGTMYGIAGDTFGKIWVTDYNASSVARFSSAGTTEVQTKLAGTQCYNYSDWNGIVLKTVTLNNAQAGTWTREYDSGSPATSWGSVSWEAVTPPGTSVAVNFRAGANQAELAKPPSCGPFYAQPVDLTACNFGPRQWLQVAVVLNTNDVNVRPTLSNLKVYSQ